MLDLRVGGKREVNNLRNRVRRMYGLGRISLESHQKLLAMCDDIEREIKKACELGESNANSKAQE